jgi:hypothetical protein
MCGVLGSRADVSPVRCSLEKNCQQKNNLDAIWFEGVVDRLRLSTNGLEAAE